LPSFSFFFRGQIFDCLRSSEGTPRRRGLFFLFFYRTRTIFPLSRAREVYSIEDEGSTRAPRLAVSHAGETPIRYPASRERRVAAKKTARSDSRARASVVSTHIYRFDAISTTTVRRSALTRERCE